MLTNEQGVKAIIDLQKVNGVIEDPAKAKKNWEAMSDYDMDQTEAAHKMVCGGFPDAPTPVDILKEIEQNLTNTGDLMDERFAVGLRDQLLRVINMLEEKSG